MPTTASDTRSMGTKLLSCMFPVMTSVPSRCSAIIAWSSCERTGRLSECLSQHTAMSNVSNEQEKITADAVGRRCHMTRARFVLLLLVAVALALVISWPFMLPDSPKSTPGSLTERDKREISYLCRRHSVRYCIDNLRRGEFGAFSLGRSQSIQTKD